MFATPPSGMPRVSLVCVCVCSCVCMCVCVRVCVCVAGSDGKPDQTRNLGVDPVRRYGLNCFIYIHEALSSRLRGRADLGTGTSVSMNTASISLSFRENYKTWVLKPVP